MRSLSPFNLVASSQCGRRKHDYVCVQPQVFGVALCNARNVGIPSEGVMLKQSLWGVTSFTAAEEPEFAARYFPSDSPYCFAHLPARPVQHVLRRHHSRAALRGRVLRALMLSRPLNALNLAARQRLRVRSCAIMAVSIPTDLITILNGAARRTTLRQWGCDLFSKGSVQLVHEVEHLFGKACLRAMLRVLRELVSTQSSSTYSPNACTSVKTTTSSASSMMTSPWGTVKDSKKGAAGITSDVHSLRSQAATTLAQASGRSMGQRAVRRRADASTNKDRCDANNRAASGTSMVVRQ